MTKRADIDAIRSKPMVDLTPEELALLDEKEQRWVIAFLAMPPAPKWPYSD